MQKMFVELHFSDWTLKWKIIINTTVHDGKTYSKNFNINYMMGRIIYKIVMNYFNPLKYNAT